MPKKYNVLILEETNRGIFIVIELGDGSQYLIGTKCDAITPTHGFQYHLIMQAQDPGKSYKNHNLASIQDRPLVRDFVERIKSFPKIDYNSIIGGGFYAIKKNEFHYINHTDQYSTKVKIRSLTDFIDSIIQYCREKLNVEIKAITESGSVNEILS